MPKSKARRMNAGHGDYSIRGDPLLEGRGRPWGKGGRISCSKKLVFFEREKKKLVRAPAGDLHCLWRKRSRRRSEQGRVRASGGERGEVERGKVKRNNGEKKGVGSGNMWSRTYSPEN